MTKSNATETDILAKIFTATALPWDAETDLQIHLHIGDPGEAGTSATSPPTYSPYAAVTVARSTSGWTVTGNTCANDNLIQFPQCASGSDTLTHVSITPDGDTQILYSGVLSSPLNVSAGIQPQFAPGALTITED
jgi:hypothetical protein